MLVQPLKFCNAPILSYLFFFEMGGSISEKCVVQSDRPAVVARTLFFWRFLVRQGPNVKSHIIHEVALDVF